VGDVFADGFDFSGQLLSQDHVSGSDETQIESEGKPEREREV